MAVIYQDGARLLVGNQYLEGLREKVTKDQARMAIKSARFFNPAVGDFKNVSRMILAIAPEEATSHKNATGWLTTIDTSNSTMNQVPFIDYDRFGDAFARALRTSF